MKSNRLCTINNFHSRYVNNIDSAKIAGWSSAESQKSRFDAMLRASKFSGGSVVDYGCGPGDLYRFIKEKKVPFEYLGLDQSSDMIFLAKKNYGDKFQLIDFDQIDFNEVDYVYSSGIFQFKDSSDKFYYKKMLEKLFAKCKKCLSVTFLSSERDDSQKVDDELYITPVDCVNLASNLTKLWSIDHSYHPGYGDMTVALFRTENSKKWCRPTC